MYATLDDMCARFGKDELLQVAGSGPRNARTLDTNQGQAALNDASGLINSYLQARYALPLSDTPTLLVGLCCDIARHELRARVSGGRAQMAPIVRQRYEDALALLKGIACGKGTLGTKVALKPTTRDTRILRVGVRQGDNFFDETRIKEWP